MARLQADPNAVAPTRFARFLKTRGEAGTMAVGDEYLVRMPGPWDGPVRVIAADATSFRLATLAGHLEAGQIEFRASRGELLEFEIESWARSGDRVSNLALHAAARREGGAAAHVDLVPRARRPRLRRAQHRRRSRSRRGSSPSARRRPARVAERPRIEHELAALRATDFNFEPRGRALRRDRLARRRPLPAAAARGAGAAGGERQLRGRAGGSCAATSSPTPSIVRAYFDERRAARGPHDAARDPLPGPALPRRRARARGLRAHGRARRPAACTSGAGATARSTGHFEMGQMDWQVWKWLDTGEVEFRIHAYSRRAPVANPVVRLGFRAVGRREQLAFLHSTMRRMAALTALQVEQHARRGAPHRLRRARRARRRPAPADARVAEQLTARTTTAARRRLA